MLASFIFDEVSFNPESKELTFSCNGSNVSGPHDLSATSVKFKVYKDSQGNLKADLKTPALGSLNSDTFALNIDFAGDAQSANLFFGTLTNDFTPSFSNTTIGVENKLALHWVGSDNTRNNLISPSGVLLVEGEIVSIEIKNTDETLILQYHDSL